MKKLTLLIIAFIGLAFFGTFIVLVINAIALFTAALMFTLLFVAIACRLRSLFF